MVFHTNPCKFLHFWTVVESFVYQLRVQIACCEWRLESHEASGNVFNSLKIYKFVWKTTQLGDWVASTKPSNFQLRLRSAIATFGIHGQTFTGYLILKCSFQFLLTTVFVFSESWSHDQLMQKTHCISLQASLLAGYYCIKYGIRTPPPLGWGPMEFF